MKNTRDSCFYLKKSVGNVIITSILDFNCHAGGMVMADIDELKRNLKMDG